jgi:hypothetical protein
MEKLSHVLPVKQNDSHNPANVSAFTGFINNFEYADLPWSLPFSESSV